MARPRKKTVCTRVFLFIVFVLFLAFVYVTYNEEVSNAIRLTNQDLNGIKVSYLDVGQADSILIQVNNEAMLIDAGNNDDGKGLVKYLKDRGINNFKYVVGTHAHEDHIGGMDDVILNFDIEHFYMSDAITTTKTFEDVLDALEEKQVKFETPKIDDEFKLGDANIKVIYVGNDSENLNNSSIVLKLTYKNIRFLFTGDVESSVEKAILDKDIQADILKVGHHGSSTSSSDKFIKSVNPSYAIISVGKDNSYKHPNKKTLTTLEKYNAKVLRTDELGTIIFTSDGTQFNYTNIKNNIYGGK